MALAVLTAPLSLYGLGLGKMTVKSALDQPFLAEIELEDAEHTPLSAVRVSLGDPESFQQIGLEVIPALSLLSFKVDKDEQGKPIVKVQSTERITEPYMDLVVDLAWSQGQVYKSYTILLDPPGYQLTSSTIQGGSAHYRQHSHYTNEPGVINKTVVSRVVRPVVKGADLKQKASYGPTVANENVWQIAQRYKTAELILPQVVLAIVGANPDSFKEGNLNGLKVGVRLRIPATSDIALVPADLATAEIMAQDKAWNDHSAIDHVLMPPYNVEQVPKSTIPNAVNPSDNASSQLMPVPATIVPQQFIPNATVAPIINTSNQNVLNQKPQGIEQDAVTKAELSVTYAVIESVREANALLMEQLRLLQTQNKTLQQQLDQRENEIKSMRTQIQILVKQRQGVASQANDAITSTSSANTWLYLLLLFFTTGSGGFAYWYWRSRQYKSVKNVPTPKGVVSLDTPVMPSEQPIKCPSTMIIESDLGEDSNSDEALNAPEESVSVEMPVYDGPTVMDIEPEPESELVAEPTIDFVTVDPAAQEEVQCTAKSTVEEPSSAESNLLEFETGLHHALASLPENTAQDSPKPVIDDTSQSIDFVSSFPEKPSSVDVQLPLNKQEIDCSSIDGLELALNESQKEPPVAAPEHTIEIDDELAQFFAEQNSDSQPLKDALPETAEVPAPAVSSESEPLKENLLKSSRALDTLLALAKTYISMDDKESAKSSLEEVIAHGTEAQKEEALHLLKGL